MKSLSLIHIEMCIRDRFQIGGETVNERQNDIAEEQQPLALAGVGNVGKLMGRNIELL